MDPFVFVLALVLLIGVICIILAYISTLTPPQPPTSDPEPSGERP